MGKRSCGPALSNCTGCRKKRASVLQTSCVSSPCALGTAGNEGLISSPSDEQVCCNGILAECGEEGLAGFTNSQPTEKFLRTLITFSMCWIREACTKEVGSSHWMKRISKMLRDSDSMTQYLSSLKEPQSKQKLIETALKTGFLKLGAYQWVRW